ncbi:tetratricopeptide repeat-containing sensor histidine kinase [Puia dinghuensis]|uniref:Histidine kinase domain-containing protein n=1 Tax=Puia dinghuensis TaxID=1792502 RepID=A0A8J2UDH8_9BACT|nr:sensor histidine kinase [Puia dinghuensis]GGB02585.1 hypothetical protein GCM10011511_27340 [Puia dinghuensis]
MQAIQVRTTKLKNEGTTGHLSKTTQKEACRVFLWLVFIRICLLVQGNSTVLGQQPMSDPAQGAKLIKQYYVKGEYSKIPDLYHHAMSRPGADQQPDSLKVELWYFMALTQFEFGRYDSCAWYDQKIISLYTLPDKFTYKRLFGALNIMGMAEDRADNEQKALGYYQQGAGLARAFNDTTYETMALVNSATVYDKLGDYEKSQAIGLRALALSRPRKQWLNIIEGASMVGKAYSSKGNYKEELAYMKEAYDAALAYGAFTYILNQTYWLGESYLNLKEYSKAEDFLLKALQMYREKGQQDNLVNVYKGLSEAYTGLNDFRKAAEFMSKYALLKDTLRGNENARRIVEIEAKYQSAEKDKQLSAEKLRVIQRDQQIMAQRQQLLFILFVLLLVGIAWFLMYRNSRNKQQIALLKAKIEGEVTERQRLSRELHDGIASQLLSIRLGMETLERDAQKTGTTPSFSQIASQLEKATKELRNTAHNLMPELLVQKDWLAAIALLCQNTTDLTQVKTELQVLGEPSPLSKDIELSLYRIVQELVQNAVKHAKTTNLLVQVSDRDGLLALTVEDDGVGFETWQGFRPGSGLSNARKRVEELGGHMDIKSRPGNGATVYIEFKIRQWRKFRKQTSQKA